MDLEKLYFENEDSTICQALKYFLRDAKIEGLKEIELMEAIPDTGTNEYIWCTHDGEVVDRGQCKKSECSNYYTKSGRGACSNRGSLYWHGEKVKFKVE